ncbi:hypothetical protein BDV11DRAFT_168454 [Aspergillus similis]
MAFASRCKYLFFTPLSKPHASFVCPRTFTSSDVFNGATNGYGVLAKYYSPYIIMSSSPISSLSSASNLPPRPRTSGVGLWNGRFGDMAPGLSYGKAVVFSSSSRNSIVRQAGNAAWASTAPKRGPTVRWRKLYGCSTGGSQGLKSVQMVLEVFDGLWRARAWWTTHQQSWDLQGRARSLPNDALNHSVSAFIAPNPTYNKHRKHSQDIQEK